MVASWISRARRSPERGSSTSTLRSFTSARRALQRRSGASRYPCRAMRRGSSARLSSRLPNGPRSPVGSTDGQLPAVLREQVESIRLVADELGADVPVIQTVFSPLTVAGYLGRGAAQTVADLRDGAPGIETALTRISDLLIAFVRASVAAGAAGVFYAIIDHASEDRMSQRGLRLARPALRSAGSRGAARGGLVQHAAPVRRTRVLRSCVRSTDERHQLVDPQPG